MKEKTKFVCGECGYETVKWMGCCPMCGSWNTLVEVSAAPEKRSTHSAGGTSSRAVTLGSVSENDTVRVTTGIGEFDRVLGGGVVVGSTVLIGGDPGIGKSTLIMQAAGNLKKTGGVIYVSGEESKAQLKLRAVRCGVDSELLIMTETSMDAVENEVDRLKPRFLIIDSIQTMMNRELNNAAGSVTQIREATTALTRIAKQNGCAIFIIGHVTKEGALAGPRMLEHMVDTVLYFEGDKMLPYRILRAAKNRYGSTNELGMFDMTGQGLAEIENPSQMLLEGRPLGVSGNCVACTMEGSRPILSEIQALATKTNFPAPRRACSGYDYNRMNLLIAVLEKRAGYFFGNLDVYINIVGGIALRDTACDLSVCLSMVSSLLDRPVSDKLIAIGEVGLGGEVRSVPNLEQRLHEAERIGFERAVIPKHSLNHLSPADYPGMQLIGAAYITDAINALKSDRL